MANTKISALTSSTTPLAGTEVLPIVQSSATVKVAVSDLTAGRSVSMSAATISSGNLTFSTTGQRITGDFSDNTVANRPVFQSSTVNGATRVSLITNGTGVASEIQVFNGSDPANAGFGSVRINASDFAIQALQSGTGTYLPIVFSVGGSERVRMDTSGNVRVTSAGGGLGYGTGSGGTVTQATSKSTTVTLNKPTGQITMNNASLLTNTIVQFQFDNSLLTTTDVLQITQQSGNGGVGNYNVWVYGQNSGSAFIAVKNISAFTLSDALVLNFAIIKGATS
jgi:hypothetical protein